MENKEESILVEQLQHVGLYEKRVNGEFAYYFVLLPGGDKEYNKSINWKDMSMLLLGSLNSYMGSRKREDVRSQPTQLTQSTRVYVHNQERSGGGDLVSATVGALVGAATFGLLSDDGKE